MATKLLSIDEIMAGTTSAIQDVEEAGKKKQAALKEQEASSSKQAGLAEETGNALAAVKRAEGLALLEIQKKNLAAAEAAGITEGANILLEQHALLQESQRRTIAKAAEVRNKWDSTIERDGFLGWLKNGLTVDMTQNELAAATQEMQTVQGALLATNNTLQETFQTNAGMTQSYNMERIAAESTIAAADAKMRAEAARIQGQGYNIAGIDAAKDTTLEKLQVRYQGQSAAAGVKQLQMAEEDQAMQRQRFNWEKEEQGIRKQLLDAQLKDKTEEDRIAKDFVGTINLGRGNRGMPALSEAETSIIIKNFKGGALGKEAQADFQLGMQSRARGGKQFLGNTPAETIELLSQLQSNLPAAQEKTQEVLSEALGALGADTKVDKKNPQAVTQFLNKRVKETVDMQFTNGVAKNSAFDVGDLGNPSYLSNSAISGLPIVQKFLAPLAANKQDLSDPKMVLELVRAGLKKGELTSSQAASLADVYRLANDVNQAQKNFTGYGIKLPKNGAQYIVKVGSEKIDLTQPEQIQRYIMKPPTSGFSRTDSPFMSM